MDRLDEYFRQGRMSIEQVLRIPSGDSQVRAAKVLHHGDVYSDHLSLSIEKRSTRTAECRCRIINNLVVKQVADVPLGSGWPNELLRSHPQHNLANALRAAGNLLHNLRTRSGENAFNARGVADQDHGFPRHAGFVSIIKLKKLRVEWPGRFEFERCKVRA